MWSAAILAGGRATRFGGRDKGALLVDGQTIRDRQIAALSAVTDDILIVGGQSAHPAARSIADTVAGCGPMAGVHAALAAARGGALFVAACDKPYITAPFVAYMLVLAAEADGVVPQTERGHHLLAAVYTP